MASGRYLATRRFAVPWLLEQPFARAAKLQPGAVDDQNAVRLFQNAPGSEPAVHKPDD